MKDPARSEYLPKLGALFEWVARELDSSGRSLDDLPRHARYSYCLFQLYIEVSSGGFDQYYLTTRGKYVYFALAALRDLGLKEYEDLVARSLRSWSKYESDGYMPRLDEGLESLNDEFIRLERKGPDLVSVLGEYLAESNEF